jgi:hypothetical protein
VGLPHPIILHVDSSAAKNPCKYCEVYILHRK